VGMLLVVSSIFIGTGWRPAFLRKTEMTEA
jgi:hypothetical protein